jgi:hypothetical protein
VNAESFHSETPGTTPAPEASIEASVEQDFGIEYRRNVTIADLWRKEKPSFGYDESVTVPRIKNLKMPGVIERHEDGGDSQGVPDGHIPRIISALRYKDMTDAAEARYGLPKGMMLAMIAEGSGGVDTYVDDDGAVGVIPIGAYTAKLLGLRVAIEPMNDEEGALELRSIVEKQKHDRDLLVGHDERLHPLASIDAAARRMAAALGSKSTDRASATDPMAIAFTDLVLEGSARWGDVTHYEELVTDAGTMAMAKGVFERFNPDLKIDGAPAGFDEYLAACAKSNARYGVAEYAKLDHLKVMNR